MINLIFTRKSLLAGVKAESEDLLSFEKSSQIEFGNRSMREVLEENIGQIVKKYSDYARENKIVLNGSIPASLVFPVETTAKEVHEIMHFVGTYSDVHFNIIHIDDLIQPFLHGQKFSGEAMKEPMIVLEGLDDYLGVIYYFNTTEVKHQSFITFEEKQAENHGQHIIDALIKEFGKIGFTLDENDQKELRYQHTLNNSTFFIQKSNGVATLSASVRREDLVLDKSSIIDKYTLSRILNKERLEKLGIKKIVLIGDHLVEYGYPEYLGNELGLKEMIFIPETQKVGESFLTIMRGIETRTSSPFQPELKVQEVLNLKPQEKDFLDLGKLNKQIQEKNLAEKLSLQKQNKKEVLPAVQESTDDKLTEEEIEALAEAKHEEADKNLQLPQTTESPAPEEKNLSVQKSEVKKEAEELALELKKEPAEKEEVEAPAEPTEEVSPEETTEVALKEESETAEENKEESDATLEAKPKLPAKEEVDQHEEVAEAPVEEEAKADEEVAPEDATPDNPSIEILKKSLARLADKPLRDGTKEVQAEPANGDNKVREKDLKIFEPVAQAPVETQEKATPDVQVEAEPSPLGDPVATKDAEPVSALATSPQTGIEEWNKISEIEESLRRHEEEERKKFEMLKEKLALQRQMKANQRAAVAEAPTPPNIPRKNARSINLKEAFEFIKNFPEEEFITQLVLDKNLRAKKVLRFVSNADFAQSYIEYKFLRLYDKESRYYPGISGLFESEEGKFYMRNYYKGSTLAEYANKAGLAKKHSLKKLSSSDLEFIVKVINEVSDSPVSHSNLHANNILVQEKGFWRFNTVEQIRLVGFTSDDCSQEDMLNRVHEIFHTLMAPGVYSEFRNTLKL